MQTRKQDPENASFRQDAFASSTEYERGVLGNLVAARCQLAPEADRPLLWWLQQVSWRDGGLLRLASEFLQANRDLIGTASMHRFGRAPGTVYTTDQMLAIRREIRMGGRVDPDRFPLKGHLTRYDSNVLQVPLSFDEKEEERKALIHRRAEAYPDSYPVEQVLECCNIDAAELCELLLRSLVDPKANLSAGLWCIPHLRDGLARMRVLEIEAAAQRIVETEITRHVSAELDFALDQRAFVVIEGREGIGKSEAAQNWCERHPGQAIFVKLESGTDEVTFYRAIARKVGTACSYARKAVEMRARLQDALQAGQIMVVLDESHFLWPQTDRSQRAAPKRVDWLRTALVDIGVPVALISTPQFFASQCDRFRAGGWNANQIQRRLAHTLPLPENMSADDVIAIARAMFPAQDNKTLKLIAARAIGSVAYLTAIKHLRMRVNFILKRDGGDEHEVLARALRDDSISLAAPAAPSVPPVQPPFAGRAQTLNRRLTPSQWDESGAPTVPADETFQPGSIPLPA